MCVGQYIDDDYVYYDHQCRLAMIRIYIIRGGNMLAHLTPSNRLEVSCS